MASKDNSSDPAKKKTEPKRIRKQEGQKNPSTAIRSTSKAMKRLMAIGPKPNVLQIVPPKDLMRPGVRREKDSEDMHDPEKHPLATPTGPGGASGFRNRAGSAGSTIEQPRVMNIYLGKFWGDQDDQDRVEEFSTAIVQNGYLDPLRELNYGTGSGRYLGFVTGPQIEPGSTLSDADVRGILSKMLDEGTIYGDADSLFMFILPPQVVSTHADGSRSCKDYCGYHDAIPFNGTYIAYAVLASPTCANCGEEIEDFMALYSHELAEACTDKLPGWGWVADDGQETSDLEAWTLFGWGPPSEPNLYTVQGYYTNERGNTIGAWRYTIADADEALASANYLADQIAPFLIKRPNQFEGDQPRSTPIRG
jgi:hypothetical protein